MTTAFVRITDAIIAALEAAPAVSPNIYRARHRPLNEATAINVQHEGGLADRDAMHGAPVDWESRYTVECYAKANPSVSPDLAVDPLLKAVYARLAADTTLAGLVGDIGLLGLEAEWNAEGEKTGWIRMTYMVRHRTANLTLE